MTNTQLEAHLKQANKNMEQLANTRVHGKDYQACRKSNTFNKLHDTTYEAVNIIATAIAAVAFVVLSTMSFILWYG